MENFLLVIVYYLPGLISDRSNVEKKTCTISRSSLKDTYINTIFLTFDRFKIGIKFEGKRISKIISIRFTEFPRERMKEEKWRNSKDF